MRIFIFYLLYFLTGYTCFLHAQVSYDTYSSHAEISMGSVSWNHTCSGTNRLLIVSISTDMAMGGNINSVTYNGTSLTKKEYIANGAICSAELWYLANPPSGSSLPIQVNTDMGLAVTCTGISFYGVDQSSPVGNSNNATGSSETSASVSVNTTNIYEIVVDAVALDWPFNSYTSDQTERNTCNIAIIYHGCATASGTGSSVNMSWTLSEPSPIAWAMSAMTINPENCPPNAPVFINTCGSTQLCFNNSLTDDDTPTFRLTCNDNDSDDLDFRLEIDDDLNFGSVNWTRDFTNGGSHYISGSTNNLTCSSLSGITNGTTYYVRAKAIDPEGANSYGGSTNGIYSFTYTCAEALEWFQTTDEQFSTNDLYTCVAYDDEVSLGFEWFDDMEDGTNGWTTGEDVDDDGDTEFSYKQPGSGYYQSSEHAWYIKNSDNRYRGWLLSPQITIPSGVISADVSFYHRMNTEDSFDGGWLQYRINSGSWTDVAGGDFTQGGYTGFTGFACPSGIHEAWEGTIALNEVIVPLPAGATGNDVQYKFHFECDVMADAGGKHGWWTDNFLISGPSTTGTITSPEIKFSFFYGATAWDNVEWDFASKAGGDIDIQIYYDNAGTPTIIPDIDLASNSSGFGTSPVDISGMSTATYPILYLKATLTESGGTPELLGWTVKTDISPVPIQLINFYATLNRNIVDILWSTATETNNDFFTVERSNDAVNFEELIFVPGAGNSITIHNYSVIDPYPYFGISYYRLKQTDYNGDNKYSDIIAIEYYPENTNNSIIIYPNPASNKDNIYINITDNYINGPVTLNIYSIFGKKIYSSILLTGSTDYTSFILPGETLSSGIFLMTISSDNYFSCKKLIIK